jgi:hypothetical protein
VLSQFTEVLYGNPDCETQYKDLKCNGEYPSDGIQEYGISRVVNVAPIGARENDFLWYLSMSLMQLNFSSIIETYPLKYAS